MAKRRLVVCCDGTWNRPDREGHTTNVVRLVRAVRPVARTDAGDAHQVTYYHVGVGTGNTLDRLAGGALGIGLSSQVRSAYAFLVDNYQPGDEVFLFGFSRGAYTVRSVAGMLGHLGLVRKRQMEHFDELWDYYRLPEEQRARLQGPFLGQPQFAGRTLPEEVDVACIGVWDTVGELGIPNSRVCAQAYSFHDTNLGPRVRHAYQALALDEHRAAFKPAVWNRTPAARPDQVLEQVWFPGAHSNVGGGYCEHVLSDAAFVWMAAKVAPLLDLDLGYVADQCDRSRPYAMGEVVNSRSGRWRLMPYYERLRLVGGTPTERVHASAWTRAELDPSYRDAGFRGLLDANAGRKAQLSPLERQTWDLVRASPALPALDVRPPRRLSFCDRVIERLGGEV